MSERRNAVIFSPERDRQLRSAGIRSWSAVGIVAVAVIAYMGFTTFSTFIMPLVVAVVLGMIFEPVASLLGRAMPRQLASILVLVGIGVLSVVAVAVVIFGVIDQGGEIVAQTQAAIDLGRGWLAERGMSVVAVDDVQAQLSTFVDDVLPGLLSYVPSAFSGISSFLFSTFIALFILYFVLAEWDTLAAWVGSHLGVPADLGEGIVSDATRSFRDYFYVLTLSSLPVAIIVGLTAVVLGVPLAFTIGLITFVTSYVPYLGALVSSVFALLIAFGSGGIVPALIMLGVILLAQNVVQPILQRQLERNALDLHPIVSFGSTIIGSVLVGVLGATLSAPTVAMVMRVRQRVQAFQAGDLGEDEMKAMLEEDGGADA
jgi:predicted PurR-regulated permease PerM